MIGQLSANDLKVRGITAIDEMIAENDGVVITVRGKQKYIILPVDQYNQLREFELDAAIRESRREIEDGKFHTGSIEEHLARVRHV